MDQDQNLKYLIKYLNKLGINMLLLTFLIILMQSKLSNLDLIGESK